MKVLTCCFGNGMIESGDAGTTRSVNYLTSLLPTNNIRYSRTNNVTSVRSVGVHV